MGCRQDQVGSTTGVPQIAADLRRRQSRQGWATKRQSPGAKAAVGVNRDGWIATFEPIETNGAQR